MAASSPEKAFTEVAASARGEAPPPPRQEWRGRAGGNVASTDADPQPPPSPTDADFKDGGAPLVPPTPSKQLDTLRDAGRLGGGTFDVAAPPGKAGGKAGEAIGQPKRGVAAPLDPRGEVAIIASDTPQEQVQEVLRGVSQAEVDERQEAKLVLDEYRRQDALAATPLQRAALDRLQAWDADTTGHFTTEQAFDLVRWAEKQLGAEQKRAAAEAIVGSWAYGSYGIYTVANNSGGRLFYTEGATKEKRTGLLVSDGEWYGATLRTSGADIIGFIRLKYAMGEITSNFRRSEDASWGNDVVATKAAPEEAQTTCEWQKCGLFCAVAFALLAVWMLLIGFAYLSVDTAVMDGGALAESSTGRLIGTSNVLRKHSFGSLMTMPVGDLRRIDACTLAHRGAYLVLRVASLTRSPEGNIRIISPERSVLHITRNPAGEQAVAIERPFGTREAVDFSKQGYSWLPNAPDAVGCTLAIATVAPQIRK